MDRRAGPRGRGPAYPGPGPAPRGQRGRRSPRGRNRGPGARGAEQPRRALQAVLFAAETAWQSRRIDEARQWADRGIEAARAAGDSESLAKLLPLVATLANLRGEYARAAAYQEEIEKLSPREKAAEIDIPRGGTLVVAVANPIAATEPGTYETNEEQEALANVFETLVTTDAQGNLAPGLCERWVLEEGAQTVRLHLRSGVVFSDGAPLSAPAVKASLERSIRLSRNQMPAAFVAILGVPEYLEGKAGEVSGITASGSAEIEIRLRDPLPIFPSLLSDPRTGIAAVGPEEGGTAATLGTGPFRKLSQDPDRVVLERNPRSWKEPPRLDRIEFRLSLSAATIAQGLRSGELDLGRDLLPQDLEAILREPRSAPASSRLPRRTLTSSCSTRAPPPDRTTFSGRRSQAPCGRRIWSGALSGASPFPRPA